MPPAAPRATDTNDLQVNPGGSGGQQCFHDRPHAVLCHKQKPRRPMSSTRLSFKEMCAKFDVTPRTLRYYEYIELLAPDREGRSRFYGPRDVARMTLIMRGRRFGFSLEEVRQWLLIYDDEGSEAQMRVLLETSDSQIAKVTAQIDELVDAREELRRLRDDVAKTLG